MTGAVLSSKDGFRVCLVHYGVEGMIGYPSPWLLNGGHFLDLFVQQKLGITHAGDPAMFFLSPTLSCDVQT